MNDPRVGMSTKMGRPTLSIVVITLNEEQNLGECLESVQWADEIVVVDCRSVDQTVEIARRYTEKVFVRPWPGFGPQKNFGMDQATSDWVLILDADERASQELGQEIRHLMERWSIEDPLGYQIPRRNFYYGYWVRWAGCYPDYQIRLFRKGQAYYNEVLVHENLIVQGKVGILSGHLDHYTERRIEDHFKKFSLYTTLAAQQRLKSKQTVHLHDLVLRPLVTLLKTYFLKQGFRDGIWGLIVCLFASMYTFVKYAKLWESLQNEKT